MPTCPICHNRTSIWTRDLSTGRCRACQKAFPVDAPKGFNPGMWGPLLVLLFLFGRPACSTYQRSQAERAGREKLMFERMNNPTIEEGIKNGLPGQGR
jgi:hypothetical protein